MPLSFAVAIAVSVATPEMDADRTFREMQRRILMGHPTRRAPALVQVRRIVGDQFRTKLLKFLLE
jgi:cation/acetate symporter